VDESIQFHLARIRAATTNRLTRTDLSKWVCQNTFINNRPFTTKGHEFQERIMNDPSQEVVIIKSAQLGISEMSMRMALGLVMTMPDSFAIGYVFPTAGFSQQYSKTRFNPIVQGSPMLKAAMSSEDLDSSDVKTFGVGRQVYFKGASSGNSAISTSLDMVIFDEFSFADQQVCGDYTSRLIHSPHKMKIKLSTPTFPGDPIDTAFQASKRWRNFCKCNHCARWFYPSYYDHVKIPGFSKHLDEVTAENLPKLDHRNAKVLCPHCAKPVNLLPEHRNWVCENPDENFLATGYKLSPFDAPTIITVPYLIEASTSYANKSKFRQFNLGEPSVDAESGFSEEDLDRAGVDGSGSPFTTHVMGIDLGLVCHFMVGGVGSDGVLGVVHYERVPLGKFRERYTALKAQFRVTVVVSDIQPYTDLIMSMQSVDQNLWGASFVVRSGLELFDVRQKEADRDEAQEAMREIQVNRNAMLDKLLVEVREDRVWIRKLPDWDLFKQHLQDMKRASAALRNGEFHSVWQKSSKKRDHYHFTLGYLFIASKMRGVITHGAGTFPGVSTFKMKKIMTPEEIRAESGKQLQIRGRG
jgi:hypothetical protein